VEAATRLARLRSDLAAAAGPSLGSAKEPALTPVWRRLVGCQHPVPVLPVRPHDARARARISTRISRFDRIFRCEPTAIEAVAAGGSSACAVRRLTGIIGCSRHRALCYNLTSHSLRTSPPDRRHTPRKGVARVAGNHRPGRRVSLRAGELGAG
jgi:hypothetical protein